MAKSASMTPDFLYFSKIAFEFGDREEPKLLSKIRRSLTYYKLGKIDLEKVEYIRGLQRALYFEITKYQKSKFFNKKSKSKYAEFEDFDVKGMTEYYGLKFPKIKKHDLSGIIGYALYLYYLR